MFNKKKENPNLSLTFDISPSGEYIIQCHLPKDINHNYLAILLLALFNRDPMIVKAVVDAIKYWSIKEGWTDKAVQIFNQIEKIQTGINEQTKALTTSLPAGSRNPLIKPSQVLARFKRSHEGHNN